MTAKPHRPHPRALTRPTAIGHSQRPHRPHHSGRVRRWLRVAVVPGAFGAALLFGPLPVPAQHMTAQQAPPPPPAAPGVTPAPGTTTAPAPATAIEPVNINTATAQQLADTIIGVGIKKAEAIVADREANGPFASVEELTRVPGIGDVTVASNRDRLTIGMESGALMPGGGTPGIPSKPPASAAPPMPQSTSG